MRPIRAILEIAAGWARRTLAVTQPDPIVDATSLAKFLSTRAAHSAQTALHGYLKTRMGTQFRRYFEDDAFAEAIRNAQWQVFAACLADLTVYAVARVATECDPLQASSFAKACHDGAFREAVHSSDDTDPSPHVFAFADRVGMLDWSIEATNPAPFTGSANALVAAVPVSAEYRDSDAPILENSIRLRLRNVAEDLRNRMDKARIAAAISAGL